MAAARRGFSSLPASPTNTSPNTPRDLEKKNFKTEDGSWELGAEARARARARAGEEEEADSRRTTRPKKKKKKTLVGVQEAGARVPAHAS